MNSRDTAAAHTLGVLSRALREQLDDLADRLTRDIRTREDVYDTLGVPPDDLHATCRENLERLLTLLAGDLPPHLDAAGLTVETARRRARQGVPLEVVLRAYRRSGRLVFEQMRTLSRERFAGAHDAALLVAADDLWRLLDASSDRLVDAYRREEARARDLEIGRRWALLEGLLTGRGRDPAIVADATRLLDVPADAELVCVVAPTDGADAPADPPVLPATVWHARSAEVVGIVVPADAPETSGARAVGDALARRTGGPVGVSPVVPGPAHLDVAHRWARLAARTLPPGTPAVATLDDRLPEALLVEAADLVPRLRRVALGAVLDLPEPERRTLLGTLRAVVAAGGSPTRAATQLFCHRNTVMSRLARVEALSGRRLDDPRDRLLLELALATPPGTTG